MKRFFSCLCFILSATAWSYPVNYQNCASPFSVKDKPSKMVTMDINTTEMALSMGLSSAMFAASGFGGAAQLLPHLRDAFGDIPIISGNYPRPNTILNLKPDFVMGGWYFGFFPQTRMTPEYYRLQGIDTYVIKESCIRVGDDREVTIESALFKDLWTLGEIFDRRAVAEALIKDFKYRLAQIPPPNGEPKTIFVYDSGVDAAFTVGKFTVLNDAIRRAGGVNAFQDQDFNWGQVTWLDVASRNPDLILIVDYGGNDHALKKSYIQSLSNLSHTKAVMNDGFLTIPYAAAISGIRSIQVAETLSEQLNALP